MPTLSSAALLGELRAKTPLVQSITTPVVANLTANALRAVGAAPAMVAMVGEAGPFARAADALLVDLGSPTHERRAAAEEAVAAANGAGTPWVLEPGPTGGSPVSAALAANLARARPCAIRGSASEILALAGAGRGTEGSVDAVAQVAVRLARQLRTIVVVSDPVALITDGERTVRVANGDALRTADRVAGCVVGPLIAAFAAVCREASRLAAVTAAHVVYGIAAERAAVEATGPGSAPAHLLDALHTVAPADVAALERVHGELVVGDAA